MCGWRKRSKGQRTPTCFFVFIHAFCSSQVLVMLCVGVFDGLVPFYFLHMCIGVSVCVVITVGCAVLCVWGRLWATVYVHVCCALVQYRGIPNEAWICATWLRATLVFSAMGGAWELEQKWGECYKYFIQTPPCGHFTLPAFESC